MEVRPGTLADIAAIADIEISASELFRGTHMSWATGETTDPAELAAAIARDHLWVAEIDGKLAGFLQADVCDGTFHICETAVHQSYRGQRVGAALIGVSLAEAGRNGFVLATLTTDRTLAWNAPYYERLGFGIMLPKAMGPELSGALTHLPNSHLRCAMAKTLRPVQ